MQGFIQNGIHSSELGVYYIPDENERGDFFSPFEVIDNERAWNSGGEYYGSRVKSRVFTLSCYYELISKKTREKMIRWLDRRSSGELVFDNRPYAKYFVRPTKKIAIKDYLQTTQGEQLYSGTFEITFTAYHPFAELTYETSDEVEDDMALCETGLIPSKKMPAKYDKDKNPYNCRIYNPGTETGHSIVRFRGVTGEAGITIKNSVTGDECVIRGVGSNVMKDGEQIEINSKTGRVEYHTANGGMSVRFEFHDKGYITFAPCFPMTRDIYVSCTAGSKEIASPEGIFTKDMEGQQVYVDGAWRQISEVTSATSASINTEPSNTRLEKTNIVTMNDLTITYGSDAVIDMLEIECKAEVR